MSYSFAIFSSGSPIIGYFTFAPPTSSMSFAHFAWFSTGSTLSPMIFAPRFANSSSSAAIEPSSVVHTGVKSLGCENRTAHPSPIQSWKWIVPCVVSAVKSGATSLMRSDIVSYLSVEPCRRHVLQKVCFGKRKTHPLVGSGGFLRALCLALLPLAHPHTRTGPQQQQHIGAKLEAEAS